MRLEVFCEDRLGLTQELLDILAKQNFDLRGIEIDVRGKIYLNCPETDFDSFSQLMTLIRRISGVTDVRKVQYMPSERHNNELLTLLDNLPDPVVSVDANGVIDTLNQAAISLFGEDQQWSNESISTPLPNFSYSDWIMEGAKRQRTSVVHNGLDYNLELIPVYVSDEFDEIVHASTVMTLRPLTNEHLIPITSTNVSIGFEHFVGSSSKHKSLLAQAKKLSMLDQPLLIEGETGTGKEMLARACHDNSRRASKPFLVLSCASMPDDAAESELFGHAAGSMNHEAPQVGIFESANGGTVFLDEIGEMSAHLQIKLLRFLQDGTFRKVGEEQEVHVDVRVIASTKANLAKLTEQGKFREDLYFRLNVLPLNIPPLRERNTDIAPLLDLYVAKYAHQLGITKPNFDAELIHQLSQYSWPGNIRELQNLTLQAMTRLDSDTLSLTHFHFSQAEQSSIPTKAMNLDGSLDEIMKQYESQIIQSLYHSFPSSRKLAKRLKVSHTSIANKLRDYGINKE